MHRSLHPVSLLWMGGGEVKVPQSPGTGVLGDEVVHLEPVFKLRCQMLDLTAAPNQLAPQCSHPEGYEARCLGQGIP